MSEYHIASFIVRAHARHFPAVTEQIEKIPGVEIHAQDDRGKIIVTAEGTSHSVIADLTEKVREIPHVVDIAAVYHEYAPAS